MTERLYYQDSYVRRFDARAIEAGDLDGRPYVVLDRTAFYPTSGGQPHDVGTLVRLEQDAPGGANRAGNAPETPVVEAIDREDDGAILHVLEGRIEAGAAVAGAIDWGRRFDHMQQHTGQHVLSAAFERLHQARTVGFHLGSAACTIDLDRAVPAGAVALAEEEANRVIWEDRPVSVRFATPDEAAGLPLRARLPQRAGTLRLIDAGGYDLSACGGTHVARTGEVGLVAISSWERLKGGLRVEFLCGGRALRGHRSLRDAMAGCVRALSVLPAELPAAIERAQAENRQLRKTVRDLTDELAWHRAADLAARGVPAGAVTLVAEAIDGWDAGGLKALATAVAARPGHVAALVSATTPALIVIARAADTTVDAAGVLKALVVRFGGKGGGKPDLAQGGGLAATPAVLLEAIRETIAGA